MMGVRALLVIKMNCTYGVSSMADAIFVVFLAMAIVLSIMVIKVPLVGVYWIYRHLKYVVVFVLSCI